MHEYDVAEIALGVKVALRYGARERIGVVTRFEGEHVIVRLLQAEWNEPPELSVHRDSVKCLAGWV